MKHQFVRVLLAVVLIFGTLGTTFALPSSTALAQGEYPDCGISPAAPKGHVPLLVNFTVTCKTLGTAAIVWFFFDDQTTGIGSQVQHTYYVPARHAAQVTVINAQGNTMTYRLYIDVLYPAFSGTAVPAATPTPVPVVPTPVVTPPVPQGSGVTTSTTSGTIEGNNNVAPVISGDNATITIGQPVPAAAVQPTPIPAPPLTLDQKFWLPWKTFWRGVVAVIEGWFDLVP